MESVCFITFKKLLVAGMTETTMSAITGFKILDNIESDLGDGKEHHLRDAIAWFNREGSVAPVPAGDKNLALVVRIDQAN